MVIARVLSVQYDRRMYVMRPLMAMLLLVVLYQRRRPCDVCTAVHGGAAESRG